MKLKVIVLFACLIVSFHEANAVGLARRAWNYLVGPKEANSAPSALAVPHAPNVPTAPKISLVSRVWNYFWSKKSENEAATATALSKTLVPHFQRTAWPTRPIIPSAPFFPVERTSSAADSFISGTTSRPTSHVPSIAPTIAPSIASPRTPSGASSRTSSPAPSLSARSSTPRALSPTPSTSEIPEIPTEEDIVHTVAETRVPIPGVNDRDGNGGTALHRAAEKGDATEVERLIKGTARVDIADDYGRLAPYYAIMNFQPNKPSRL